MTIQLSTAARNGELDAIETAAGTGALARIYSGAVPANCAAAASGTLLAEWTLASDWMAAAASGAKTMNGLPVTVNASASGTAGHFRIYNSAGSTCHMQGTITTTGGGGDMTTASTTVTSGGPVNITGFTWTAGNP